MAILSYRREIRLVVASEAKQSLRLLRPLTRPRSDSEGYFALAIMSAAILCRVKKHSD